VFLKQGGVGTLSHLSPESFDQESDDVEATKADDQYAYGITLWEVMAGSNDPYPGGFTSHKMCCLMMV
jgi:hypothetical protein